MCLFNGSALAVILLSITPTLQAHAHSDDAHGNSTNDSNRNGMPLVPDSEDVCDLFPPGMRNGMARYGGASVMEKIVRHDRFTAQSDYRVSSTLGPADGLKTPEDRWWQAPRDSQYSSVNVLAVNDGSSPSSTASEHSRPKTNTPRREEPHGWAAGSARARAPCRPSAKSPCQLSQLWAEGEHHQVQADRIRERELSGNQYRRQHLPLQQLLQQHQQRGSSPERWEILGLPYPPTQPQRAGAPRAPANMPPTHQRP